MPITINWRAAARALIASTLTFTSAAALAQTPAATSLDVVEVTATRSPLLVSDTLPSTTVITRADIEASQQVDLVSLLRTVAGIEIAQDGGMGGQASVFMRGSNSNQTLFMVDGVKINTVESGGAFIQHIMLDQVDHVEIVRGNVSAVYGSQAVGGVIQIFTRGGQDANLIAVNATAGQEALASASVFASGGTGAPDARTTASIAVSQSQQRGFSAIDGSQAPFANPSDNGYRNRSVSAQFGQQLGDVALSAKIFDSEARLDYDDPTDYTYLDPTYTGHNQTNVENSHLSTLSFSAHWQVSARLDSDLSAAFERDRSDNNSSFPSSFDIGSTESRTNDYTFNTRYAVTEQLKINLGIEHIDQTGVSTAYDGEFERHVDSAFAGLLASYGASQLQFNLRGDHYSDFGEATSGLLAYGYALTEHVKLIAQASSAFDAPTFDDLYYPGFSNPHLAPEKSRSVEFGLQYHEAQGDARLSLYRSNVHDLIVYDSATFVPENIDEARLAGIEFSAHAHWRKWLFSTDLTFDHPIDVSTDQPLLRRASKSGSLSLAYDLDAWQPYVQVVASGVRFDSDINTGARVTDAGYSVASTGVRYRVSRQVTIGIAADNFLNRRYQLVDGYNTPGRVLLVTFSGTSN